MSPELQQINTQFQTPGAPQFQQGSFQGPDIGGRPQQQRFDPNSVQGPNVQQIAQPGQVQAQQITPQQVQAQQFGARDVNAERIGQGQQVAAQQVQAPDVSGIRGPQVDQTSLQDLVRLGIGAGGQPQQIAREQFGGGGGGQFGASGVGQQAFQSALAAQQGLAGTQAGDTQAQLQGAQDRIFAQAAKAGQNLAGARGFEDVGGTVAGINIGQQLGLAADRFSGQAQQAQLQAQGQALQARQAGAAGLTGLGSAASGALQGRQGLGLQAGLGFGGLNVQQRGQDIDLARLGQQGQAAGLGGVADLLRAQGGNQIGAFGAGTQRMDVLGGQQLQAGQGNQQAALQAAQGNQQAGLTTGLANQATGLQAGRFNQQADIATGGANQAAALAAAQGNQQAGLQAGGLNQAANLGAQQFNQQLGFNVNQANQQAGLQGFGLGTERQGVQGGIFNQGQQIGNQAANQFAQNQIGAFQAGTQRGAAQGQIGVDQANTQLGFGQLDLAGQTAGSQFQGLGNQQAIDLFGAQGQQAFQQGQLENQRFGQELSGAADFAQIQQQGGIAAGQQQIQAGQLASGILSGNAQAQGQFNDLQARAQAGDQNAAQELTMLREQITAQRLMQQQRTDTERQGQGFDLIGDFVSDRDAKENIVPVDSATVAERLRDLPVSRWNYKGEDTPHIGPMAQDFKAQFDLGGDGKSINIVDAIGVLMAGMKEVLTRLDGLERRAA